MYRAGGCVTYTQPRSKCGQSKCKHPRWGLGEAQVAYKTVVRVVHWLQLYFQMGGIFCVSVRARGRSVFWVLFSNTFTIVPWGCGRRRRRSMGIVLCKLLLLYNQPRDQRERDIRRESSVCCLYLQIIPAGYIGQGVSSQLQGGRQRPIKKTVRCATGMFSPGGGREKSQTLKGACFNECKQTTANLLLIFTWRLGPNDKRLLLVLLLKRTSKPAASIVLHSCCARFVGVKRQRNLQRYKRYERRRFFRAKRVQHNARNPITILILIASLKRGGFQ